MNIFSLLKDIITNKKGDLIKHEEDENEFQPYLVSRWLSMHTPQTARMLNETVNKHYNVYEEKQMWYKMFIDLIPKQNMGRIKYIKKVKKEKSVDRKKALKMIADSLELSTREVEQYIEQYDIDVDKFVKSVNSK
jgi:hypothetical protein